VCAPSTEEDNVYALIIYGSMDRRVVNLIALFFCWVDSFASYRFSGGC
jgi:hypothetical protein